MHHVHPAILWPFEGFIAGFEDVYLVCTHRLHAPAALAGFYPLHLYVQTESRYWTSTFCTCTAMLGTCATFSATVPLVRTKIGGPRRGGAKVKIMAQWQWRKK